MALSSAAHPGPASVSLAPDLAAAIIDHARSEYPNEMCGVIVGDGDPAAGGRPLRWVAMRNEYASPLRYRIDARDLYPVMIEIDDADDRAFWAIVHSHVRSAAYPSPTDVAQAIFPGSLYVLVSLADEPPMVRAFRIVEGQIHEVELIVEGVA